MIFNILILYLYTAVYTLLLQQQQFLSTERYTLTAACTPRCNQATSLCTTALWDTPGKCAENVNTEASAKDHLQRAMQF